MSYQQKYLKYKKKYFELKSEYVFNENNEMVNKDTGEPISQNKINTGSNVNTVSSGQFGQQNLTNMISYLSGEEIIECFNNNNKELCDQINWSEVNWSRLLRDRSINFNPKVTLPIPNICELKYNYSEELNKKFTEPLLYNLAELKEANRKLLEIEACTRFFNYTIGGRIVTWGNNEDDQINNPPIDSGYKEIACGAYHSVALKNDGTIITWGGDWKGQRNNPPQGNGYVKIACGFFHSVALKYTLD